MTSVEALNPIPTLRREYKKASQKRYKRFGRYRVDRWMFQAGMLLIFAWLFFVAHWYHYDLDYYKCEGGGNPYGNSPFVSQGDQCRNPFYRPTTWKNLEYLPPGEYGTMLGPLFHSVYYAPFLIFGLAIGLNHILHNKRRRSR